MAGQQVVMKDPKKIKTSEISAEYNCRKREELVKAQKSEPKLTLTQYYFAWAIVTIGALEVLGYCVYQSKKGHMTPVHQTKERDITPVH